MNYQLSFKIISVLLGIMVSLVIFEVFLRIVIPSSPFDPSLHTRPYIHRLNYPTIPFVSTSSVFTTNKWGMRGENPPLDWDKYFTIITVGGSTTECFYLDDKNTWPAVLENKLKEKSKKVWVGNAGLDGHSTIGHIITMNKVIRKIKPKLVIVLCGINDLAYSFEYNKRRIRKDEKADLKHVLFSHFRICQLFYIWKQIFFDKVTVVKPQHGQIELVEINNENHVPNNLKEILPSLPVYSRNIKKIINMSREMDIKILFLTQPMLFSEEDKWKHIRGTMYWVKNIKSQYSAYTYYKMLNEFNQELKTICSENNVDCYDLASVIPHDLEHMYDICHFTDKGAALVGNKIAEYISQKNKI